MYRAAREWKPARKRLAVRFERSCKLVRLSDEPPHHHQLSPHLSCTPTTPPRRTTLLEDEDGPMLDVLKISDGSVIHIPRNVSLRPDPDQLEIRFARFQSAG